VFTGIALLLAAAGFLGLCTRRASLRRGRGTAHLGAADEGSKGRMRTGEAVERCSGVVVLELVNDE
jgi:hypothetical protein